jgi:hypothetical protein
MFETMPGSFFVSGLLLGVGLCGIHCAVLLAPVAARIATHWTHGLRTAVLFGAGKVAVFGLYGALAAVAGDLVYRLVGHDLVTFAAGMALAAMGVWFLLRSGRCGRIAAGASPVLLGVIDGLTPCGATAGFLFYVAALGRGLWFGLFAGLLFGLGTVTGPILIVCGLIPSLWSKLVHFRHSGIVLRISGSVVFFVWALLLLLGGASQ